MAHLSLFKTIFKFRWRSSPRFWEEAPEDTALAVFPNMAPIPYGAVIPDGVTPGDEFIEVFQAMSTEHGEWAKLITEQIEQSESDNEHVTIFRRIIDARILRGERDPARAATRGIRTAVIPATSPFIETTRIGNKFPAALAILRTDFMRNPTPARVELGASDDESYPEVFIGVQPGNAGHAQQPHQQPVAPQQQPQMLQQPPPQPIYQHGPPLLRMRSSSSLNSHSCSSSPSFSYPLLCSSFPINFLWVSLPFNSSGKSQLISKLRHQSQQILVLQPKIGRLNP